MCRRLRKKNHFKDFWTAKGKAAIIVMMVMKYGGFTLVVFIPPLALDTAE